MEKKILLVLLLMLTLALAYMQDENEPKNVDEPGNKVTEKTDEAGNNVVTEKTDEAGNNVVTEKKDEAENNAVTEKKDESELTTASDNLPESTETPVPVEGSVEPEEAYTSSPDDGESTAAESTTAGESETTSGNEDTTNILEETSQNNQIEEKLEVANQTTTTPQPTAYDAAELMTYMQDDNGGDPYAQPNRHMPGSRHVKAHDGFHSLKKEKYWAHWNDAFTTDTAKELPIQLDEQ